MKLKPNVYAIAILPAFVAWLLIGIASHANPPSLAVVELHYEVIKAPDQSTLRKAVDVVLKSGGSCVGGVAVDRGSDGKQYMFQAVMKPLDKPDPVPQ